MRQCSFDGCSRRHDAKGYCNPHYKQWKSGRPLTEVLGRGGVKPVVGYKAAHDRIKALKGSAKGYGCVDCEEQAFEWSLSNDAEKVLVGPDGRRQAMRYSLNIEDYDPRCKECHVKYDLGLH